MASEAAISADCAASSQSPVTWHVIFWVLVTLAISSMAQPSGRLCGMTKSQSRHRIYLCSSPILCLADALDIVGRFLATMVYLRLSPRQSCQMVVLGRSEEAVHEDKPSILHLQSKPSQELQTESSSWARWVFFIIGTLPSAIKLASFSGVPWTKVWGMVFVTSFGIIELIGAMGRSGDSDHASSVAEILDLSDVEWTDPKNNILRQKIEHLTSAVHVGDAIMSVIAIFIHLGLVAWAAENLWSAAISTCNDNVLYITGYIRYSSQLCILMLSITALELSRTRRTPKWFDLFRLAGVPYVLMNVLPEAKEAQNKTLEKVLYVSTTIKSTMVPWILLILIASIVSSRIWKPPSWFGLEWSLVVPFLAMMFLPAESKTQSATFRKFMMGQGILVAIFETFQVCHGLMTLICQKWPWVGRALRIDNEVAGRPNRTKSSWVIKASAIENEEWRSNRGETQVVGSVMLAPNPPRFILDNIQVRREAADGDQAEGQAEDLSEETLQAVKVALSHGVGVENRTGYMTEEIPHAVENPTHDNGTGTMWDLTMRLVPIELDTISQDGWLALCFFITNLVVCVCWYAVLYDSTWTVNPSWTDVFG